MREAVLALSCLGLAAAPAAAQHEVDIQGAYRHQPAHAVYPEAVGEFRRTDIYQYDQDGRDVSASYSLAMPKGRLLVTVYIYPAPAVPAAQRAASCDEEFAAVVYAMTKEHSGAARLDEGSGARMAGVPPTLTHRAAYGFSTQFDRDVQPVRAEAHLYCFAGGDWYVKYRVTAPIAVDTRAAVERFIRSGPWPRR